jgi:hypothetical protein
MEKSVNSPVFSQGFYFIKGVILFSFWPFQSFTNSFVVRLLHTGRECVKHDDNSFGRGIAVYCKHLYL